MDTFHFIVQEKDTFSNDYIGHIFCHASQLCINQGVDEWFEVRCDRSDVSLLWGFIHLKTTFKSDSYQEEFDRLYESSKLISVYEKKLVEIE